MTLRLHAAAHDAECFPRLAIFHHEPGYDGVKWSFPRRVNVRVIWVHREKFAASLKHESKPGHDNAAAHAAVVALNQANHVAFVIGGAVLIRVVRRPRRITLFPFTTLFS